MRRRAALALACGFAATVPAGAADALADLPAPPAGTLRVYLVRHGQALSNLEPTPALPEEQLDHLTELGTRQSDAAGRALASRGEASVLSSPASRARETAEVVSRGVGARPVAVDARLQPLVLGQAADGRKLEWKERIAEWRAGKDPSPPGGESMERVGERVSELVRELLAGPKGASAVVLVAHSEVIGAYLGRVRGTPPPQRYPPGIGNGSISVVDVSAAGLEAVALANYVPTMP
ncbi:MAG: histidine phosphatase family protein [Vicinamibacterales bacterium]